MTIKRHKSFVGVVMPYVVYIDNTKYATLANGGEITIEIPNKTSHLRVEVMGGKMAFHAVRAETDIEPSRCKRGHIRCDVITKVNPIGVILPMFARVGNMSIDLDYN